MYDNAHGWATVVGGKLGRQDIVKMGISTTPVRND